MTPIRRAFARAMACAVLLVAGPAFAQTLTSGKVNTGSPTFVNEQNVPLQLDATGALKVTNGGGGSASGGSVSPAGTNGTQAQSVQGITGGVPQNSFTAQFNSSLPTFASGSSGYLSVDVNGRLILAPTSTIAIGNSTNTIGNVVAASSAGAVSPAPVVSTGSSVVGKSSAGNLFGFSVTAGATAAYLAILNATAAPAAGAAISPVECIPVAVNSYVARRSHLPDRYTTGIVGVVTSSCATFTAVAPQVVSLLVQ